MANPTPQKTRADLINARKEELLSLGYMPGIVDKAMEWAVGCANGMADHFTKGDKTDTKRERMVLEFLPQYLNDCEPWIRSFGHERGERKG